MKERTGRAGWAIVSLISSVAVLVVLLFTGVSFARYQLFSEKSILLNSTADRESVYLLAEEGFQEPQTWVQDASGAYQLSFRLSNGAQAEIYATQTQAVTVCVIATVADSLEKQESTAVQLTVEGLTYTGVAATITAGSVWEEQFGQGQLYRFYNQAGEELVWSLPGGQLSAIAMQLSVSGSEPNTVFTLMTEPAVDNG